VASQTIESEIASRSYAGIDGENERQLRCLANHIAIWSMFPPSANLAEWKRTTARYASGIDSLRGADRAAIDAVDSALREQGAQS
jgi:hypothetical protein